MTAIEFLFTPFIAILLLIIINVYFGIHVIKREIIFIDIALAQIAALGSTVAIVISHSIHPEIVHEHNHDYTNAFTYIFSVGFIIIAAFLFVLFKNKKITIPLEAIIGITYAVATTATVIILDKGAGGDVHVHDMLIGSILWVSWDQVIKLLIVVLIVGIFHIIFRKKFYALSDNNQNTKKNKLWNFLFYFSFGIVIIEAVNVAGILTVFAFLIIPASISVLLGNSWRLRIIIGWIVGIFLSILGLYLSFKIDVPCSPIIIVFLGAFLIITYTIKKIFFTSTN